jgi:hypothetical protein
MTDVPKEQELWLKKKASEGDGMSFKIWTSITAFGGESTPPKVPKNFERESIGLLTGEVLALG